MLLSIIFIWLVSRFSCSYSVAAERLVLSLMCPDMDTYCVQAVRSSNVNGIGHHSKLLLVIGLWSIHSDCLALACFTCMAQL